MSQKYDIFFAAQLVDGFEEATVRDNVGKLFKANEAALEKLFSGKPQLIKRGVDKQAAIKYKAALQKAGAVALVRITPGTEAAPAPAAPAPAPAPAPAADDGGLPSSTDIKPAAESKTATEEAPAGSMADRIAALAAEPAAGAATFGEQISLAPVGSDVLNEDEREEFEELDIDTSAIHVVAEFAEPEPVESEPAPPPPDTSHMSMGEVGEDIPHIEQEVEVIDPDTSHLSMGEVGEDIPHLEEDVEIVDPDTSSIELAPEGSDVLDEQYRKHEDVEPPSTEHLSLED
jgi:hypothetical protein